MEKDAKSEHIEFPKRDNLAMRLTEQWAPESNKEA